MPAVTKLPDLIFVIPQACLWTQFLPPEYIYNVSQFCGISFQSISCVLLLAEVNEQPSVQTDLECYYKHEREHFGIPELGME